MTGTEHGDESSGMLLRSFEHVPGIEHGGEGCDTLGTHVEQEGRDLVFVLRPVNREGYSRAIAWNMSRE